ncbi:MAG: cytidine deaminase [Planctomycetes bacterium]|nr:cytidine deaminase [Planctomycetota bacterium]
MKSRRKTTTSRSEDRGRARARDVASDRDLLTRAREVSRRAHSPYSGVRIGAALRAADGRVFAACNVECASYPLSVCAERNAVAKAVSEGATRFRAIAISNAKGRPVMPCGACRQVLHEFAPKLRVLVEGPRGAVLECRLDELLPDAFGPADLE